MSTAPSWKWFGAWAIAGALLVLGALAIATVGIWLLLGGGLVVGIIAMAAAREFGFSIVLSVAGFFAGMGAAGAIVAGVDLLQMTSVAECTGTMTLPAGQDSIRCGGSSTTGLMTVIAVSGAIAVIVSSGIFVVQKRRARDRLDYDAWRSSFSKR